MNLSTPLKEVVKFTDMTDEMKNIVLNKVQEAFFEKDNEKDIATFLKEFFEKQYKGIWHCIVGRNFGSFVTHESRHYIYLYIGQTAILLYKTS